MFCTAPLNVLHSPPKVVIEQFETLKAILKKTIKNLKHFHIAGDFNRNILDNDKCSMVHSFLNLLYKKGIIPTIKKSTRVTRKNGYSNRSHSYKSLYGC